VTTVASPTLIALAPQYAELLDAMLEAGGDLSDEDLASRFAAIEEAFSSKVDRCQMMYRSLMADAKAAEEFAKPYMERAAKRAAAAERLKQYVAGCMKSAGQDRVETEFGGARLQKNNPSVEFIGDAATLPEPFRRTTHAVDATAVLAAAKAAQPLPDGVRVVNDKKHLRWL
jgi:hypothetical protein